MSDSESLSGSSNTTVEDLPVESVVSNLKSAAADALESEDYLSYSTMVDIYLSDPNRFTNEEKEQVLQTLLDVLQENPKLTYEIGWDLPSVLLPYFEVGEGFEGSLRNVPGAYKLLKVFECLSNTGNPKELFLKGCELLSELKIQDSTVTDDELLKERFYDIKFYSLVELVNSSLHRIETLYSSRFLSMYVAAMLNTFHCNFSNYAPHNIEFIFKRIFSTTRNYDACTLPEHELSDTELKKVLDDEEYLQRKLLQGFLTNAVFTLGKNWCPDHSVLYFSTMSNAVTYRSDTFVLDRLHELCYSFDIDLDAMFVDLIVSTHTIFHKFDLKKQDDELVGDMFEALVVDYQNNLLTTIVNKDIKEIQINKLGCLIYHIHKVAQFNKVEKDNFSVNITFSDSLVLTLRLIIPAMVNPGFNNTAVSDVVVFWAWYTIQKSAYDKKDLSLEISSIPKVYLVTYFQCLLFIITSNPQPILKDFRYVVLTLLTRILILSPEQISYDFIKDCLDNCSFPNVRVAMWGILKELLTKDKVQDKIAEQLSELSISKEKSSEITEEKKVPPPLPSRDAVASKKYLALTPERFHDIVNFVNEYIAACFVEVPNGSTSDSETETEAETGAVKSYKINNQEASVLSVALNLLVAIKNNETTIKHKGKIDKITETVTSILKACRKQYKESEVETNILAIIAIAVDRIKA